MLGKKMSKFERDVRKFHRKFGVPVRNFPTVKIGDGEKDMRSRLIQEESFELTEALESGDIGKIAQESIDLLYVTFGTLATYGLTTEGIWNEVQKANMKKVPAPDGGKIRKPDGWRPPRMAPHIIMQDNARHSPMPLIWAMLGIFVGLCVGFWAFYTIMQLT